METWDPAAGGGAGAFVRPSGSSPMASAYGNPYLWTGQRWDASERLYHFPFRTYSPGLARWHQRDPLGYVDGVNLYEYAQSTPAVLTDPLGLTSEAVDWDGDFSVDSRRKKMESANRRACDDIRQKLVKKISECYEEVSRWDRHRRNVPGAPGFPGGCIDTGHQEKFWNKCQRPIFKLLRAWQTSRCDKFNRWDPFESYRNLVARFARMVGEEKYVKQPFAPDRDWWELERQREAAAKAQREAERIDRHIRRLFREGRGDEALRRYGDLAVPTDYETWRPGVFMPFTPLAPGSFMGPMPMPAPVAVPLVP